MTTSTCEPLFLATIDGPPPLAPTYGLIPAAGAPAAGVRIVPDGEDGGVERWVNGAKVWPYPPDTGDTFAMYASGSEAGPKRFGDEFDVHQPEFEAFVAYLPITCKVWKVPDQAEFRARAIATFTAVESSIVAREFMNGSRLPANPHLADGAGQFPIGDASTSVRNGIALLEDEIATTGRAGVIHVSPSVAMIASTQGFGFDNRSGVIRTINGTVIVVDAGYAHGKNPNGHAVATGSQNWIYATGPVDIRRSETFVMPESVAQAVDRGTVGSPSAGDARHNTITYRVERYYLVDWDTQLQAAVLVDRCQDGC